MWKRKGGYEQLTKSEGKKQTLIFKRKVKLTSGAKAPLVLSFFEGLRILRHFKQKQKVVCLLTGGAFCKGCRPLPRWQKADWGCGSLASCPPRLLNRRRRAERRAGTRRCRPPSPARCRRRWSLWDPGAAEWIAPDAWLGGHFGTQTEGRGRSHNRKYITLDRFQTRINKRDSENHPDLIFFLSH